MTDTGTREEERRQRKTLNVWSFCVSP